MNFNQLTVGGRLTRDPETRYSQSGTAVVKFGLAINRKVKDREGNWSEKPVFLDVTLLGKRAEAFAKYHSKGSEAFLYGGLDFDHWTDKDTQAKRSKLYMLADGWEFVGSKSEGSSSGGGQRKGQESYTGYGAEDDLTPF